MVKPVGAERLQISLKNALKLGALELELRIRERRFCRLEAGTGHGDCRRCRVSLRVNLAPVKRCHRLAGGDRIADVDQNAVEGTGQPWFHGHASARSQRARQVE